MQRHKWNFDAKDEEGKQINEEIEAMIKLSGLDQVAYGRCSILLVLQLFAASKAGVVDPAMVVHEIAGLEAGMHSTLKASVQNKHPPLKGLWHKHYLQTDLASLAMNVQKGLNRYGMPYFDRKIEEAEKAGEERYMTVEDVQSLANDLIHGNLGRLRESSAMTGEWLIFAKHEGHNYYLSIATHDISTHQHIRQQIDSICCMEFPFLSELLSKS